MTSVCSIALTAGGSGGHVFPAIALSHVLSERGWSITLMTDKRGQAFAKDISDVKIRYIRTSNLRGGVSKKLIGLVELGSGILHAYTLLKRIKPSAAVGFGGYSSIPTVWAATGLRIPTLIHEQNAVLGRANRLLASRVEGIATSFQTTKKVSSKNKHKIIFTGNPVRSDVSDIGRTAYPPLKKQTGMNILIVGGSQGAKILSKIVPNAISTLPGHIRSKISVVQQCRPEDLEDVKRSYLGANVKAILKTFFHNLPEKIAAAHLVIARAGASTIAELLAAGRPSILVPYPHAIDHHQTENATAIQALGGCWLLNESEFTVKTLADLLCSFFHDFKTLQRVAAKSKLISTSNATESLANAITGLATKKPFNDNRKNWRDTV